MSDQRESTETMVKRHIETRVQPLENKMDEYAQTHAEMQKQMEKTQALSIDQMQRIREMTDTVKSVQEASNMNTEMLLGKLPPDENAPGLWREVVELKVDKRERDLSALEKKKSFGKIRIAFIVGVVTAIGTGLGGLIWFLISGDKVE